MAQLAVVHVHRPLPGDLLDVDAQSVSLLDVVVQHGGQQVVGRADGVEVAGEVQVNVLHGDHLGVSAACRAALDAEHRAQGGLTQSHHGLLADLPQAVGQAHGGGGLPLAGGGGGDGGDQNQLAVLSLLLAEKLIVHFGLVVAVQLQVFFIHTGGRGDFSNILGLTALCDLDIRFNLHGDHSPFLFKRYTDSGAFSSSAAIKAEASRYSTVNPPPGARTRTASPGWSSAASPQKETLPRPSTQ